MRARDNGATRRRPLDAAERPPVDNAADERPGDGATAPDPRPVVFLGPSLPPVEAAEILDAEYRPPIRRGDLAGLAPGTVTAIIDGVFDQDLAVSPGEMVAAIRNGVVIFGGASMGALRAAEVPGVIGVGQIYAWYRDGVITRDDEVALLFDPDTLRALTVPTVNVRFAVERLARPGTIEADTADSLLRAAAGLPYTRRTYRAVVEQAGLGGRRDSAELIRMLAATDLKRLDARAVLEAVDSHRRTAGGESQGGVAGRRAASPRPGARPTSGPSRDEVLIWESGDRVDHDDLLAFLCYTGALERYALRALFRSGTGGAHPAPGGGTPAGPAPADDAAQGVLTDAARRWGWMSPTEARVTLADLSIDLDDLDRYCVAAAHADAALAAALHGGAWAVRRALRIELFLDDLAVKREAMRLGALRHLAALYAGDRSGAPVPPTERRDAEAVLCKVNRVLDLPSARRRWAAYGWSDPVAQDTFVDLLARARHAARRLHAHPAPRVDVTDSAATVAALVPSSPKPPGERRFCTPITAAGRHAARLADVIGVTRIGMIGELAPLGGIQIAQAARPGGAWSSSYGSGKSRTPEGAVVGGVLEELEKWAQERFDPDTDRLHRATYREVADDARFVDPHTLDLPYDSVYTPESPLIWYPGVDLLTGQPAFLPLDVVRMRRSRHDICHTGRGSRKHLATNGLGSGFSLATAALHAICEYVERHAQRLAEILLVNPGGLGPHPYRFIDLSTAAPSLSELADRLAGADGLVRVLDITCEVAVPTFVAMLIRDRRRADGFGTHPDPVVAAEMALLEAAQTVASAVAGGREDLSIRARSLGRHERPRPTSVDDVWFWMDPDPAYRSMGEVAGFSGDDVRDDLAWTLARIRAAGLPRVVMVDLTTPEMAPAHVVRVLVPGLETNNPFFTGTRARLALLRDVLPRAGGTGYPTEGGHPCSP